MKLYEIGDIPKNLLDSVGGKARGLDILKKHGYEVPEGFIVYNAEKDVDYSLAAQHAIDMGMTDVAVRSSATLEDGVDYSSAGQFSTYLNLKTREEIADAIRMCVESLDSETAKSYRDTFLNGKESTMTVVVQSMVDAASAGVIFTESPADKEKLLVEAVEGLGENLVSGIKSAQQYLVDEDDNYFAPSAPILKPAQVKALANEARRAEKVFGLPLDLEWAINGDGKLLWLQARPITISDMPTLDEFDPDLDISNSVMTTCNIREMMPGAVTPLTLSTNMFALDWGIRKIMHLIGCMKKVDDLPPFSCIAPYNNQMFFNLSNTYIICHSVFLATKPALDTSICGRPLDDMPDIENADKPLYKRIFNTILFLKYIMGCKPAMKRIQKISDRVSFHLQAEPEVLYKEIMDQFDDWKMTMFYHYWSSFYSGTQSSMVTTVVGDKFPDKTELTALLAGALTDIEGIESVDILSKMQELAKEMILRNPRVKAYSTEELMEEIAHLDGKALDLYKAFMAKHGHRGIREPELRSLSWSNDPRSFANNMKSILSAHGTEAHKDTRSWTDYAEELTKDFKGTEKKIYLNFVKNARKGVYCREFTKSRCILVVNKFKTAFLALANSLVEKKILPEADLIYFLTKEEIGELINNKNNALVKKAIARRKLLPQQMDLKYKEYMLGKPEPIADIEYDSSCVDFKGTPVSRGIATGRARIVRSVEDANTLEEGDIMVASFTDIGWSPYYSVLSGLVTEIGSSLSHGVVVAREYGLPTVVNVENALSIIKDGDLIRIDGNKGAITVLQRA